MNSSYYQTQVARIEKDIADLYKKIADEAKKEADKQKQISSVNRSITNSTSLSTIQSKQRQVQQYNTDIINIKNKVAGYHKTIASKSTDLGRKKQDLIKAEEQERKKLQQDQLDFQQRLQQEVQSQTAKLNILIQTNYSSQTVDDTDNQEIKQYDFFISHASEDKEDIVRELAEALKTANFNVWYDEFELHIGDSLRKKIDQGLANSRFGIVIISQNFIRKNWTEYELNGMVAREMNGHKVILPIWHKVTKNEVLAYSPTLADKMALNTSLHSIEDIVNELKKL